MTQHIYIDESGNLDFSRREGATRYFLLASVVVEDESLSNRMYELQQRLIAEGHDLPEGFHAARNRQAVRNAVFEVLQSNELRIFATILDKPKTPPEYREDKRNFYPYAWVQHMNFLVSRLVPRSGDLAVVNAVQGTNAEQKAMRSTMGNFFSAAEGITGYRYDLEPANRNLCLQAADYCAWAIGRRWERGDFRSYDLIKSKIEGENHCFRLDDTDNY